VTRNKRNSVTRDDTLAVIMLMLTMAAIGALIYFSTAVTA